MIASVTGEVEHIGLDHAVLRVGGVVMLIYATPGTLASLVFGRESRLATSLVVREDSVTLYGFTDDDERGVFQTVQTVSGVGPRLALAMLAVHTPDGLRRAIADADHAALQRVPGIGKKGAQRIVLEIGEKLGAPPGTALSGSATQSLVETAGSGPGQAGEVAEVVEALVQLGWNEKQAGTAVNAVLTAENAPEAADRSAVLRAALQQLGGSARG